MQVLYCMTLLVFGKNRPKRHVSGLVSTHPRVIRSKPFGGIRSFLAVRLGLANADSYPCLYLQRCFSKVLLVQSVNFYFYGVCKLVLLGSPLGHPKGVPCAELASRRLD